MGECDFLETKGIDTRHRENRRGYLVRYPNGYESWSPEDIFEKEYYELLVGINGDEESLLPVAVFPSEVTSIAVKKDDEYGGAHQYQFLNSRGYNNGKAEYDDSYQNIRFAKKEPGGTIIPGLQTEQLLFCIVDRHIKLNNKFPSDDGLKFIRKIEEAILCLEDRIRERISRGVMGELKE